MLKYLSLSLYMTLFISGIPALTEAQVIHPEVELEGSTPRFYKLDARSLGMGSATVADPLSVNSFAVNPAVVGLAVNRNTFQMNSFLDNSSDLVQFDFTTPGISMDSHHLIARIGYLNSNVSLPGTSSGSGSAEPNLSIYQMDVAYAFSINSTISFGVLNNFSFAKNRDAQFWTYYADLGLLYTPSGSISYGMAFRGLGRTISYQIIETGQTTLGSEGIRQSLELGATLQFPVDTDRPYLSVSLSNEKRFGESGIWYKGGFELKPIPYLALRSGILFQPELNEYAPRFGIGFSNQFLKLDYALAPKTIADEQFHQLAITIQF